MKILGEQEQDKSVADICRDHGISQPTIPGWKSNNGGMDANQLQQLHSLRQASSTPIIQNGSLVTTDQGLFYLSIGLGKLIFEEHTLFVISPASPIGKAFLGKKINEVVTFGATKYTIHKTE